MIEAPPVIAVLKAKTLSLPSDAFLGRARGAPFLDRGAVRRCRLRRSLTLRGGPEIRPLRAKAK
jgi:hypothetical protein